MCFRAGIEITAKVPVALKETELTLSAGADSLLLFQKVLQKIKVNLISE